MTSLVLPVALAFNPPNTPVNGAYEQGLFCDSIDLVEFVVDLADQGGDPHKAVNEINKTLDRRACLYTTRGEVFSETLKFERTIAANKTTYGIYRVKVTGLGHQTTEVGDLVWKFSQPLEMYTLRRAPASTASH